MSIDVPYTTAETEQEKVLAVLMSEHRQMKDSLKDLKGVPERIIGMEKSISEIKDTLRWMQRGVMGLVGALLMALVIEAFKYVLSN